MPRKRKSVLKPKQEKKRSVKKPAQEKMTPGKAMDTLIRKIDAINQSRGINHGFAPPMFASLALASRCTGKPADPVDLSKYLTSDSPDDGACQSQTSLFRSTERNSIGCHRNGCAYATGSAWLPSVLGEYCTSCDTFLTEANGGGKATALVRFFWYSSISVNGHSDTTQCVAQEDLVDLAFALLVSRGEEKAIQYCLDFDEKQYDAVITSKAFREGVAELRGEYSRYKKAAALVALAAIVGAAVYLHKRDERGLRGAWEDVSTKLSGLYTSTFPTADSSQSKKKRKTPKRSTETAETTRRKAEAAEAARKEESEATRRKDEASEAAKRKAEAAEATRRKDEAAEATRRKDEAAKRKAEAARRKDEAAEAARKEESEAQIAEWKNNIRTAEAEAAEAAKRKADAARRKDEAAEAARKEESEAQIAEWKNNIRTAEAEAAEAAKRKAVAAEAARKKEEAADASRKEASEAKIIEWESDIMAAKARKATAESRRQTMTARREQKLDDDAAAERRRRRGSAKDSINPAIQEHARKRRASAPPAPPAPQPPTSYEVGTRTEAANAKKAFEQALRKNREEHWSEETWLDWIDRNTRKLGFDVKKYMSPKEKAALRKSRRDLENSVKDRIATVQAGLLDVRDTFTSDEVAAMFQPWKQSEIVPDDNLLRTRSRTLRGSDRPEVTLSNWQS